MSTSGDSSSGMAAWGGDLGGALAHGRPFAPAAGAGEEPGQHRACEKGAARESLPHGALHSIGSEGDARGIPGILGA